jgi:hypothetical protein
MKESNASSAMQCNAVRPILVGVDKHRKQKDDRGAEEDGGSLPVR